MRRRPCGESATSGNRHLHFGYRRRQSYRFVPVGQAVSLCCLLHPPAPSLSFQPPLSSGVEGGESSEPGERSLDFLTSSFVFIDILALFPRLWCSADSRVCGPRPAPAIMEKPQTAEPAVCATKRFVLILCFHRHSRFVPSFLVAPTFRSALWPNSSRC